MSTILLVAVGGLVAVYVAWGLILLFLQSRLLYRPTREVSLSPADAGLGFEEVAFRSSDGVALHGWYVPADDARCTVLLCHGNAGNVMHRLDLLGFFHSLGLSCFVFDYRGYGRSAGRTTEAGTYLDARAAYDWLVRDKSLPADRIILLGRSLGGSIAAHLACRVLACSLVIEGAFTSFADIAARYYPYLPVRRFVWFRYDTQEYIEDVNCPVLILHSRADGIVPFEFGARLFQAANGPKRFVEIRGGHNDGLAASGSLYKETWQMWLDFLQQREAPEAMGRFCSIPGHCTDTDEEQDCE
ncbi:MAG: alpha/beta hydrolase [Sedimentisphaerales bacterium]|nr:alpha/beta hydrolase [Sedimentisphaerales bacterium]